MNPKIILGVTGSIAAYKSLTLVRLLVKEGADVKVIMTETATQFVSPLSFATLSKNEVHVDLINESTWANHVELGLWADLMIIAPATAATLSKMAHGHCDNMLLATYLSAKCPVYFAPAMDLDMYRHPSTQNNISTLQAYSNIMIPVGHGELASGLVGEGRMAEPSEIVQLINKQLYNDDLIDKKVIITAGPTQESLDPIRFISNHSTGKMGIELARECVRRGAVVTLVLGPTSLTVSHPEIKIINVRSAQEMYEAVDQYWSKIDIAVFAAAVADYRPKTSSKVKIKKRDDNINLELERTPDIAALMGQRKTKNQITVGFALETHNAVKKAVTKIKKKNFNMIVLNTLEDQGAGFGPSTNKVSIIHSASDITTYPLKPKNEVAHDIVDHIARVIVSSSENE